MKKNEIILFESGENAVSFSGSTNSYERIHTL